MFKAGHLIWTLYLNWTDKEDREWIVFHCHVTNKINWKLSSGRSQGNEVL